ncbi:hypothetical protein AA0120_g10823 [Alternaria tenuissima]|nr:hypothetical protein AA0120_g10823 [Alternaria tenuissima]
MGNATSETTVRSIAIPSAPLAEAQPEGTLLPLTSWEHKQYNQLAIKMDYFYNIFRDSWRTMNTACQNRAPFPPRTSLSSFLDVALHFCTHLKGHHDLEETYYFPILARKMPCFTKEMEMPSQHKQIHGGLLELKRFLERKQRDLEKGQKMESSNGQEFEWERMKGIMDTFGDALWRHLDEEVEMLGAENMRRYWTLDEMRCMPF